MSKSRKARQAKQDAVVPGPAQFRDRIKELRRVKASELVASEKNWRTHSPEQQAAMRGILKEVGWVDGVIAREEADGSLHIINGHLRQGISADDRVPVLITDLTAEEADKVLLTFDPISGAAGVDDALLAKLIQEAELEDDALRQLIGQLAADEELYKLNQADDAPDPEEEWQGMPEFVQGDLSPWKTMALHFANREDYLAFQKLIGQTLSDKKKFIWFPHREHANLAELRYDNEPDASGVHHQQGPLESSADAPSPDKNARPSLRRRRAARA